MKKIIIGIATSLLLAGAAFADSTNVGLKLSYAKLSADGTETSNSAGAGSTAINFVDNGSGGASTRSSGDKSFPLASIFIEREIDVPVSSGVSVAIGLDLVPLTADAKIDGGTATDATVEISNQYTAYIQPTKSLDNGLSIFAKIGYSKADLDVKSITRQATTNGSGTASTDASASKNLEGPTFGLGVQKSISTPFADFVRLEVSYTDYDDVSYTNSNGKVLTADADLTAINLSIGKKF